MSKRTVGRRSRRRWVGMAAAGLALAVPLAAHADQTPQPDPKNPPAGVAQSGRPTDPSARPAAGTQMAQANSGPVTSSSGSSSGSTANSSQGTGAPAPPPLPELPADLPPAVRAYLEALQKHVQELERQLAEKHAAETAPPTSGRTAGLPPGLKTQRFGGARLEFQGYAETRITNIGNAIGDRTAHNALDFQIARFRPRFNLYLDKNWEADAQLNVSTRGFGTGTFATNGKAVVDFRDAYVEYHNANAYGLRFGQQKVPYGYEDFVQGDEARPALERARFMEFLIPDERDIGGVAYFTPTHKPFGQVIDRGPLFAIGVINGSGLSHSAQTSRKAVAATGRFNFGKHHTLGLSGYSGTTPVFVAGTGGKRNSFDYFVKEFGGIDHEMYYGRFKTEVELMAGRLMGRNISGGYGQVEYNTGVPGVFFVKYDWFDPNTKTMDRSYWNQFIMGWYKDFTKTVRITAQNGFVHNAAATDPFYGTNVPHSFDTYGVEFQVAF